jgi:preprotein translocase subunit Sss1
MPATYSKKRKTDDDNLQNGNLRFTQRGGPLKRRGDAALAWDEAVGESLRIIPSKQLPLVRTVLQRYRGLRIDNPYMPKANMISQITKEIVLIWEKARLPTMSVKSCERKVFEAVEMWGKVHRKGGRKTKEFQMKLDTLLTIAQRKPNTKSFLKDYENLLKSSRRATWEEDFKFFMDQYQVCLTYDIIL